MGKILGMENKNDPIESSVNSEKMERKPRIDADKGLSPLQQQKMLPEEAHDLLLLRKQVLSQRDLIAEIESRYGIERLTPPRPPEFFAWLSERSVLRRMRDDAAPFRENFGTPTLMTPEEQSQKLREVFGLA